MQATDVGSTDMEVTCKNSDLLVPISSPKPEISLGFKVLITVSLSMEMTSGNLPIAEAWHTTKATNGRSE